MFKFEVELLLSIVFELSDRQNNGAIPKKQKEKKKKRKAVAYRSDVTGAKDGKKKDRKKPSNNNIKSKVLVTCIGVLIG